MVEHISDRIRKPFFTPGTYALLGVMAIGFSFGLTRILGGLGAVTNLDNFYPWGIWIAIDIACGVALAAGGFTTAALVEIFGKKKFHALLRPAILTAWLGYAMVAFGLLFDLGRYWNIWRPIFNWQGNSALFEVGMCVMAYLTVLTIEMSPSFLDGVKERMHHVRWGKFLLRIEKPILMAHRIIKIVLPIFIIAGVVLSFMHQSSLGTLILIAPSKVHTLWYTPFLPLLFLMSAVMVGFPMVIIESLISSKSFNRVPETHILAKLARMIPWFIGAYAVVKFGDLIIRSGSIQFFDSARNITAFSVEIIIGIILPFILFNIKSLRRSPEWLLFASLLVVAGVVLNRINVYMVAYKPPYATGTYFPSIGEIFLTLAMVSTLMLLYRVVVTYFPVIEKCTCGKCLERYKKKEQQLKKKPLSPAWAWIVRGAAVLSLLLFVVLYTQVHKEAVAGDIGALKWAQNVKPLKIEPPAIEASEHMLRPEGYKNLYMLNNEILNSKTDFYESVRFTHRTHDVATGGNCGLCHHRISFDEEDRVGMDVQAFHSEDIEVRLGNTPCGSCHDMNEITIQKCSSCHWLPNEADEPSRLGLKGAYHRQCIGCHEDQPAAADAPVGCMGCHHPFTPDHAVLVNLSEKPDIYEVTLKCLECHKKAGEDILSTAHWSWEGHSPEVSGHEHSTSLGRKTVVNNCSIATGANNVYCAVCHIGFGWEKKPFDFSDAARIDCLVCHDTTGTYEKVKGGFPAEDVDLAVVARNVGRPSRENCGLCHFNSGGGSNFKHGDLEPILADAPDDFDIHMGKYNMKCQECHTTRNHQIAGMSLSSPAFEGRVQCVRCHGEAPHGIAGPLSRHIDNHLRAIACETCHIPEIAKDMPTRIMLDFSQAGQDREPGLDEYGKPTYDKKAGVQKWMKNMTPEYEWYDGTKKAYVLGDRFDPSEVLILNQPLGERLDPSARIYPFKVNSANQPYDSERNILVVPKFYEGYWDHFDWNKAITEGMKDVGMEYSGSYGFVKSKMYISIHHEVVPAKKSLGCVDCHSVQAVTCRRCHGNEAGLDLPEHTQKVYPDVKNRFDFKKLGYQGDPALIGGRFYIGPGHGKPKR